MSWGNGAILSLDEVKKKAERTLSEFQVGEPVGFWIEDGDKVQMFDCYIVAVGIMNMHRVRYDLAFQIGNTPYYVVMKDVRGRITHREEKEPRDLVDDPIQSFINGAARHVKPRPALAVVPKTDSAEKPE
jgi:hypothetical protein